MTKEQIIKWLDEGYCVPVELRNGSQSVIDPNVGIVWSKNDCEFLSDYGNDLRWIDGETASEDIVRVFNPFRPNFDTPLRPNFDTPLWEENNTEELKEQLAELEKKLRQIDDEMQEIKNKMK